MANIPVFMPSGVEVPGYGPIVVVGPNGSGKTRESRKLSTPSGLLEFVNALRSTRISPQIPAMSQMQARQNHEGHRQQARNQPWEITSDFDFMVAQILAEDGDAAREYRAISKAGGSVAEIDRTPLERLELIWGEVFPGRGLQWRDWAPVVTNERQEVITYSANQMSDGERAALYLGAKVMLAPANSVMVIDEPETHFHSLLAIALWDALESHREDMRFIYVTHDLAFAMSRQDATYLLADGAQSLQIVTLAEHLPLELKKSILGAASFSYYASRIVFCEGETHSLDTKFLSAWFNGRDTVIAPVGSCDAVRSCVEALSSATIVDNLTAVGVIDRDFRPDEFLVRLSETHTVLPVHEVEGLLCLPEVCDALADHLGRDRFNVLDAIQPALTDQIVLRVAHERWKSAMLTRLEDAVTSKVQNPLTEVGLIEHARTAFANQHLPNIAIQVLAPEIERVRSDYQSGDLMKILRTFPSKQLVSAVAQHLGQSSGQLFELVSRALVATEESPLAALGKQLETAFDTLGLPPRRVNLRSSPTPRT